MDQRKLHQKLKGKIKEHGYTFVGVFAEGNKPSFVYTIGLTNRGWPEVVMIGNMNPVIAQMILTDLIEGWKKAGEVKVGDNPDLIKFKDGSDHPLRIVEIPVDETLEEYACKVPEFCRGPYRFVQALWPDLLGSFPDEPGYLESMTQPIVGRK